MTQPPLTLPLSAYPARHIALGISPPGHRYPAVLEIELLGEAEVLAVERWLSDRARADLARLQSGVTA